MVLRLVDHKGAEVCCLEDHEDGRASKVPRAPHGSEGVSLSKEGPREECAAAIALNIDDDHAAWNYGARRSSLWAPEGGVAAWHLDQARLEHAEPKGLARASCEAVSHSGVLPEQWREETIRLQVANAMGGADVPAMMAGLIRREKLVRRHPASLVCAGVSGVEPAVRGFRKPRDHRRRARTGAEDTQVAESEVAGELGKVCLQRWPGEQPGDVRDVQVGEGRGATAVGVGRKPSMHHPR